MIEIDEILAKCGDFHRYQIILLGLFCLINLLSSMHYYSQTIISFVPEHWCYDTQIDNFTMTYSKDFYNVHGKATCKMDIMEGDEFYQNVTEVECTKWIYKLDYGYQSMTSELNWVCQWAWKSTLGQSMFFIGSVLGTLTFGIYADKIGRLPVLILSNMTAFIGNISTMFTVNVLAFSISRFISGMATDSNFVMMYILVMEYIRPSMRTKGLSICIGIFYCVGSAITPWIAVWCGSWKLFLLVTAFPLLFTPFFYFAMPESAQWLITKKRYEKAKKCLNDIARVNGKIVTEQIDEFIATCSQSTSAQGREENLIGLFKTPRLRRNTLILFFKSMVITLCYDAISKNVEGLGISPFAMFSLSASSIFPACIVLMLFQDRIGRKAMASISMLISGIFTSATGIILAYRSLDTNPVLVVILAVIGRFGVTVAYNSAAQFATELIPTSVRGQGVAAVHVAGYAFTSLSSYILFLSTIFKPLPSLILGAFSLMGAGLCLFLPETLNRTLPSTLEDGEQFGRGENVWYFSCFDSRKKSCSTYSLKENLS